MVTHNPYPYPYMLMEKKEKKIQKTKKKKEKKTPRKIPIPYLYSMQSEGKAGGYESLKTEKTLAHNHSLIHCIVQNSFPGLPISLLKGKF